MKWCPTCHKMAPDKLEMVPNNVVTSLIAGYLYLSFVSLHFPCLFLSQSFKSLAQPCCKCCSLSVSVVVNMRFTTNGMCGKKNTHVSRTSGNKTITTWDLYCCLVPQCEALCTCCSAFRITTKWCFDQDLKAVPGTTFTKRTCNRCGSLQKRWDVVATSRFALH